jgi:hypothetical protein
MRRRPTKYYPNIAEIVQSAQHPELLEVSILPSVIGHALELPPPYGGIRPVGGLMLLVAAFQLPVWQDAVRSRVSALIAILGHFLLALLWAVAGGLFLWIALFELVFAILLAWLLYKYMAAELMSRP